MIVSARRANLGFTMIEALVALAIVAVALAAIGSLAAFNIRGTARLERQLALAGTTRAILAMIATRRGNDSEFLSGELDGYRWQVRSRQSREPATQSLWNPRGVRIVVRSPDGREFQLDSVGLRRAAGGRG